MRPRPSRPRGNQGAPPPGDKSGGGSGRCSGGPGEGACPLPRPGAPPRRLPALSLTTACDFPGRTQATPAPQGAAQLPVTRARGDGADFRRALYANDEAKTALRN